MSGKKGLALIDYLGEFVLVLILLAVAIVILVYYFQQGQAGFSGHAEALVDEACKVQGQQMKIKGALSKENDIDEDGRPDFACDSCVCQQNQCPNSLSSNNDVDKNGNRVPDGCEDYADKADPWWEGCKNEQKNSALRRQANPGNIIVLDQKNKLVQCRLGFSSYPINPSPVAKPNSP